MKVIVVDDERFVLNAEESAIKRVLPDSEVYAFLKYKDALAFAEENRIDIAFLDINIKGVTGLQIAETLKKYNEKINIIFCTGYSEYSLEAHDLFCSAYLMKPITDEKLKKALDNLRYPISNRIEGFYVKCFGNFEVYKDGLPIKFKHKKTKEMFAYLIDRQGATASTKEMMTVLYEDDKESYVRNLRADLNNTFEILGLSDVLIRNGGDVGVNMEKIECDYYNYLEGNKALFNGEYMSQYSFAETTLGWLLGDINSNSDI